MALAAWSKSGHDRKRYQAPPDEAESASARRSSLFRSGEFLNRNIVIAIIACSPFAIAPRVGGRLAWSAGNTDREVADFVAAKNSDNSGAGAGAAVSQSPASVGRMQSAVDGRRSRFVGDARLLIITGGTGGTSRYSDQLRYLRSWLLAG